MMHIGPNMSTRCRTDLQVDTNQNPNTSRTQVTFSDPPVTTIGVPNQDMSMTSKLSGILQPSVAGSKPHPKKSSLRQRLSVDLLGQVIPSDPKDHSNGIGHGQAPPGRNPGGNGGGNLPGSGGNPPGRGPGGSPSGGQGGGPGRNPGGSGGGGGGGNPYNIDPSDPRSPELIHILHTVCRKDTKDSLVLSLWHHKFHHHSELLMIDESIIQQLEYQVDWDDNDQPVMMALDLGGKYLIRIIQAAHTYLVQNVPSFRNWFDVTAEWFNNFRGVIYPTLGSTMTGGMAPPTPGARSFSSARSTMTKADRFQKNIKLDREHYPTLKYDDQWDRFTRGMYATALTHDTHMVLDPHYDPSNDPTCDPEDVEAFKRKKEFMYTVFLHVLKTDIGQSIVIDHEETQDGQAVFRDLKTHYELSTASHLSHDQLLNTIMMTTLDARALHLSYTSFVL